MKDGNKMGVVGYILESAFWMWLALAWFEGRCFGNFRIPGTEEYLGYFESYQILLLLVAIFSGVGTLVTLHKRRRMLCLAVNVLTPLEIYLFPLVGKYCPVLLWGLVAAAVMALLFYSWVIFIKSEGRVFKKCAWYFHGSRVMLGMIFVPLLLYTAGMERGYVSVAEVKAAVPDAIETYSLENHIGEVSLLEGDRWTAATMEERAAVLQTIAGIETRYLGLERIPQVKVACLTANTLGKYAPMEDTVFVSADLVRLGAPEDVLDTLLHEIYHAYERRLADLYLNVSEKDRKLLLMRTPGRYQENFSDYTDGSEDYENYLFQSVERDARKYAEESVMEYYEEIAKYLKKQEDVE